MNKEKIITLIVAIAFIACYFSGSKLLEEHNRQADRIKEIVASNVNFDEAVTELEKEFTVNDVDKEIGIVYIEVIGLENKVFVRDLLGEEGKTPDGFIKGDY